LLAAPAPHSGDCLHTLSISACGFRLENNASRLAVGLRFGSANNCDALLSLRGALVNPLGQRGLSCKKNTDKVQRRAWLNDLMQRTVIRAEMQAVRERQGLNMHDGKRPDSLTLVRQ